MPTPMPILLPVESPLALLLVPVLVGLAGMVGAAVVLAGAVVEAAVGGGVEPGFRGSVSRLERSTSRQRTWIA